MKITTGLSPSVLCLICLIGMQTQSAFPSGLEELVVTARKKEEALHNVPISAVPVSGEKIQQHDIANLAELSAYVPNVHIGEDLITSQLYIRGIGSGINPGFEQSVGVFIDGVYFGRGRSSRNPFLDIERVEVLRGPQSVLFGKNTVAGALNIVTANPTETWENSLTALYETELKEYALTGVLSGPLSGNLGMRAAFRAAGMEGWIDNTNKHETEPKTEDRELRLTLDWQAANNVEVLGKIWTGTFDTTGRALQVTTCSPSMLGLLAFNGFSADCSLDERKNAAGTRVTSLNGVTGVDFNDEQSTTNFQSASAAVNWNLESLTVTSITAYSKYDFVDHHDLDLTPLSFLSLQLTEDYNQASQELRVATDRGGRLDYTAGIYWERSDLLTVGTTHISDLQFPGGLTGGLLPIGPLLGTSIISSDQEAETFAVFGEINWRIDDRWNLIGGLRYTKDKKAIDQYQVLADLGATTPTNNPDILTAFPLLLNVEPYVIRDSFEESNVSPGLTVQWQPDDTLMTYASVKAGYKVGGFDFPHPTADTGNFRYEDEEVTAYELGAKKVFPEVQADINVAIFKNDFEDVQVSVFNGVLNLVVDNAAETRSQGVEIDGRWRASDRFSLRGMLAYLDSKYVRFPGAQCYVGQTPAQGCINGAQDLSGKETLFSPEWSANLTLEYRNTIFTDWLLTAALDYQYVDEHVITDDLDPNLHQSGFSKYNLLVGLDSPSGKLSIAFIGKNLTDEITGSAANDVPVFAGSYFKHTDPPRTLALQVTYRY
ncbi:MAG TPA: TonB-dependent receptor [Gammaproteobacteria bacterium]